MEGAVGSYKCKGKALASAADDFKDEVLACPTNIPVTKDPDEVLKQPTTTQAEYEEDGNGDLIEAINNDHKKKRKAKGEPDKVPVKQNKLAIDLSQEPPEEPRNMTADLLRGFGNEICHSAAGSSESSSDPVDLELRLGLADF